MEKNSTKAKIGEYLAFAGGYFLAPKEDAPLTTVIPKLACEFSVPVWTPTDDYDTITSNVTLSSLPPRDELAMVLVRLERVPDFPSEFGRHYDSFLWGGSNLDFLTSETTVLEIEASMFKDHFDSDDQLKDGETVGFHILCVDKTGLPIGFASSVATKIHKTAV